MSISLRDPIHGFIKADDLEGDLISSRPMQRLRLVRQLGLSHLVFPGAEHSRFAHALGTMHLAGRLYDALATQAESPLPPTGGKARRNVRIAALLHDIGHAPFSHTAEDLFDEPIDHEEMTRRLLDLPEMQRIFERHQHDPAPVLAILDGSADGPDRILSQIVSGELDVDKMDYLLRDSLFCGVRYGQFDLDRLLDTVLPLLDPRSNSWGIGVVEGGVHALEALVLARYYMFTQVYFNVTGKVLELHLGEWLRETGTRWRADPTAFLEVDDVSVLSAMRRSPSVHAAAVLARRHFVLAHETREHLEADEKRRFEERLAPLQQRYGAQLLVSNSAKDPHRLARSRVLVQCRDGLEEMATYSNFIRHLTRIDQYRVYCDPAIRDDVASQLS
ncbi:MAG: HD domain-containing protein [Acidobacteria bacterium]|nr:MAG: HD domain-containing protein [Acidobacteriota bacterium]REK12106.1 MAG: HD domain-containing protein [Acidobacteriota bacterium]